MATAPAAAAATFDGIDRATVDKYLADVQTAELAVNRAFYEGDHWQAGAGWIGPQPADGEAGFSETMALIQKAFTSRNVVSEVIERHVTGVVGHEPEWGLALRRPLKQDEEPTTGEQALIDEAEAVLTDWWNNRGLHATFQHAVASLLFARRAMLRLYIPAGRLTSTPGGDGAAATSSVVAADVPQALDHLFVDHPLPEQATVYEDADTKELLGIFTYETKDKKKGLELVYLGPPTVDPTQRVTRVRTVTGDADSSFDFLLGGRLTMFEASRDLFITTQVQQQQRAVNLAESVLPRNVVTGGFLERVLLNAQMPGEWEEDDKGNRKRFVPAPYTTGSGTTNFVRGIDYVDPADGTTKLATPSVVYRDPVEVKPADDAARHHYRAILEECDQAHILITGDATASGLSREQARADFENSLKFTQNGIENMGRWLVETALAMAEMLVKTPGKYTTALRAYFNCNIDTGPLSADEQNALLVALDKGVLSRETVMSRLRITDVDVELSRINGQESALIDLATKQAVAVTAWLKAGLPLEEALLLAGFDDAEAKRIANLQQDTTPVQGDPNAAPPGQTPPPASGAGA